MVASVTAASAENAAPALVEDYISQDSLRHIASGRDLFASARGRRSSRAGGRLQSPRSCGFRCSSVCGEVYVSKLVQCNGQQHPLCTVVPTPAENAAAWVSRCASLSCSNSDFGELFGSHVLWLGERFVWAVHWEQLPPGVCEIAEEFALILLHIIEVFLQMRNFRNHCWASH